MKAEVFIAIPNYNMGSELKRLLPTVINRGYKRIYVLDDCSTDDSEEIVKKFKGVTFSRSSKNIGAGATRNRILDFQTSGIVHFLDADMELVGKSNITKNIVSAFERHKDAGTIGFRVKNPGGDQYGYNFGPPMNVFYDGVTHGTWRLHGHTSSAKLKNILSTRYQNRWDTFWTYMNPAAADYEHQVGSVVECNIAVRLKDFAKVGGFDTGLRFHEIASLSYKLQSIGKTVWYVPEVTAVKHNEIDVRQHRMREIILSAIVMEAKRRTGRYRTK